MRFLSLLIISILLGGCSQKTSRKYYDLNGEESSKRKAFYYRQITQEEERAVKEFFTESQNLRFQGYLSSSNPDVLEDTCRWYWPNGQLKKQGFYLNGEEYEESREWSQMGKEEGLLDETEFFYSREYFLGVKNFIEKELGMAISLDSQGVKAILNSLPLTPNERDAKISKKKLKVAHDIVIRHDLDSMLLAKCFSDLGDYVALVDRQDKGLNWYLKAKMIYQVLDAKLLLAEVYNDIGLIMNGTPDKAIEWHQEALGIFKNLKIKNKIAQTFNKIGEAYIIKVERDSAKEWFNRAIRILNTSQPTLELAETYSLMGHLHFQMGLYDDAITWNEKALSLCSKLNQNMKVKTLVANTLNGNGASYAYKGDFKLSLEYFNKAVAEFEQLGRLGMIVFIYNNIGDIHFFYSDYPKALEIYKEVLGIQKKLNLNADLILTFQRIGNVYLAQNKYKEALNLYNQALNILGSHNFPDRIAEIYRSIGGVYSNMGNYSLALNFNFKAKAIQQKHKMKEAVAITNDVIGDIYYKIGANDQAIYFYQQALKIVLESKISKSLVIHTYLKLSVIYGDKREFTKAMEYLQEVQKIAEEQNDKRKLSIVFINIGNLLAKKGDYKLGLNWLLKAEEIHEKEPNWQNETAYIYHNLGFIYDGLEDQSTALAYYQKAKEIRERLGQTSDIAATNVNIAKIQFDLGDFEGVLKSYYSAKKIWGDLNDEKNLQYIYHNLSFLFDITNQPDSCFYYAQAYQSLIKSLRLSVKSEKDRSNILKTSLKSTESGTHAAVKLNFPDSAFAFSEFGKARGLLDLLAESSVDSINLKNDSLRKNFELQIQALYGLISIEKNPDNQNNIRELLDSVKNKYDLFISNLRYEDPAYVNLIYPESIGVSEVQSSLLPGEIAISYLLGEKYAYAFLVRKEGKVIPIRLDSPDEIKKAISAFRKMTELLGNNSLISEHQETYSSTAWNLRDLIWQPVSSYLKPQDQKVVLIPDNNLFLLPFEMLPTGDREVKRFNWDEYQFLFQTYDFKYYPSASVFHFERSRNGKIKSQSNIRNLMAWGDPIYEKKPDTDIYELDKNRYWVLRPDAVSDCAVEEKMEAYSQNVNASETRGLRLNRLSYSCQEVKTLKKVFPGKSTIFLRNEASEDLLWDLNSSEELRKQSHLHFAVHSFLDNNKSEENALCLTMDQNPRHDGRLMLDELFRLNLNAELVVFSACQTAGGKIEKGEGVIGFSRGLFYAGAKRQILSQWSIYDSQTADFFGTFYKSLKRKPDDYTGALKNARHKMIESGNANPYYWAPFVMFGG